MKVNFFIIITLHITLHPMTPNTENKSIKKESKIEYIIRKGKASDRDSLKILYSKVASIPGGLVRSADEITDQYIDNVLNSALEKGIIFVAEYQNKLIGSVVKYKSDIKALSHTLEEGSILVDAEYQGIGIGTKLYTYLLNEVKEHHSDILRVDLKVRISNPAIRLYERLGFIKEGEFKNLVKNINGKLESVIAMTWFNPNFKDNNNENNE